MRSTLAGLLAGLSLLSAALLQPGPWTVARGLAVLAGVLVGVLGAVTRDHVQAAPVLAPSPSLTREEVVSIVARVLGEGALAATATPVDSSTVAAAERVSRAPSEVGL
jgi:hypothetical protein